MVDYVLVGREDAVGEPVVAHELPDIFDRVEFGAFGRQRDDADVCRHFQLAGHVPARLIHEHDCVSTHRDSERYLGKMERHGFRVAEGQHQPCALAELRADRTKDVDRLRPLVLGRRRSRPTPRPAPRELVLLADAGFILEPYLYGCAAWEGGFDLCQLGCEPPFLKASISNSFWAWWRGRAVSLT
jgi:hypothetical protein